MNVHWQVGEEFAAAMHSLAKNESVRAVVLTGAGRAFSAGGDLEFLKKRAASSAVQNTAVMRAFYGRFLTLRSLPVPIIAAINGPAVGAGWWWAEN